MDWDAAFMRLAFAFWGCSNEYALSFDHDIYREWLDGLGNLFCLLAH